MTIHILVKWMALNNLHNRWWKELGSLHNVKMKRAPWRDNHPQVNWTHNIFLQSSSTSHVTTHNPTLSKTLKFQYSRNAETPKIHDYLDLSFSCPLMKDFENPSEEKNLHQEITLCADS